MPAKQKYCAWEVLGLALMAVESCKNRFYELGKKWPVKDDAEMAKVLVCLSFQESSWDKTEPYCDFDRLAKAATTSATGLTQMTTAAWEQVQTAVLEYSKKEKRPLTDRTDPKTSMFFGAAYLLGEFMRKGSGTWRNALNHYYAGGIRNSAGASYASKILDKHMKLFDWVNMTTMVAANSASIAKIGAYGRREYR